MGGVPVHHYLTAQASKGTLMLQVCGSVHTMLLRMLELARRRTMPMGLICCLYEISADP